MYEEFQAGNVNTQNVHITYEAFEEEEPFCVFTSFSTFSHPIPSHYLVYLCLSSCSSIFLLHYLIYTFVLLYVVVIFVLFFSFPNSFPFFWSVPNEPHNKGLYLKAKRGPNLVIPDHTMVYAWTRLWKWLYRGWRKRRVNYQGVFVFRGKVWRYMVGV